MKKIFDKVQIWILIIALIVFGIWMIVDPNTMDGTVKMTGRRFWLKSIVKFIWGVPGGILLVALGGLSAFGLIKGHGKEGYEENDLNRDNEGYIDDESEKFE